MEPGNTTYRRDLSISYERLGALESRSERASEAHQYFTVAVDIRRHLYRQEPHRVDLAEELAVALRLLSGVDTRPAAVRTEVVELLGPFESAGTITRKGAAELAWARTEASELP